jgi:hypothetical protein
MTRARWLSLALASSSLPLIAAGAQRPVPVAAHRAGTAAGTILVTTPAMTPVVPPLHAPSARPRARAWPYVVGGAVLGGAIMAGGIALALQGAESSLTHPVAYVPAVAGAAVLGGAGGYVVYRLRF